MPLKLLPIGPKKNTARLAWESKPRREIGPRDLEFQTAEVVYPNPGQAQQKLPIASGGEVDIRSMNRLIWGDSLLAMQALLSQGYEGKTDLIYIDPPFLTSEDYFFDMGVDTVGEVTKEPSIIERLAYTDTWNGGIDSYLNMLFPRLRLMKRLLSDQGSIYVHIGPNMSHYVKVLLDEVFGESRYVNEIVWKRTSAHSGEGEVQKYGTIHEALLYYAKGDDYIFNRQYQPYDKEYEDSFYRFQDPDGRRYMVDNLTGAGVRRGETGKPWKGVDPTKNRRHWIRPPSELDKWEQEGRIAWPKKSDGMPRYKRYLDEMPGVLLSDIWQDIQPVQTHAKERVGYPTQKPEALVERIVKNSSNPGSLVCDFFAGSGTTGAVAERLGRRWIMSDFSKVAIQVARARLVEQGVEPFAVENVGNYQRELIYALGGRISEMQKIVLKLFGAAPHPSYQDLGVRSTEAGVGKTLVFAGYPDRPVTAKKALEMARLAATLDGSGYDKLVILGWDYDYNFDAALESLGKKRIFVRHASDASKREFVYRVSETQTIVIEPRVIPPSIYDYLKRAKDADEVTEQITFHEKPYLRLTPPKVRHPGGDESEVSIGLQRYVLAEIPLEDARQVEQVRAAAKDNFAILIDYWAVDWDYDGATFRSRWQAFRGNETDVRTVPKNASTTLANGKQYRVMVRVVDVFGNDASGEVIINLPGES